MNIEKNSLAASFFFRRASRCAFGLMLVFISLASAHAQSPFLLNPIYIKSSSAHTCAITSAGGVKCWGRNEFGQLGDGTTFARARPTDVVGLTSGVTAISTYSYHTCAILASGAAKCWGYNANGQLGDGTTTNRSVPVFVNGLSSGVTAISTSDSHTCAVVAGGVKCWGLNVDGQLGNGSTVSSAIPVSVTGVVGVNAVVSGGQNRASFPVVGGIVYGNHTCAKLLSGGVKCWGSNAFGQLGDANIVNSTIALDVPGIVDATQLVAGVSHNCVRDAVGGVKCWGMIEYPYQWGRGLYLYTNSVLPINITNLVSGVVSIFSGGSRTCARMVSGETKCWGLNLIVSGAFPPTNQTPPGGNPLVAPEFESGAQVIVGSAGSNNSSVNRSCFVGQSGHTKCSGVYAGDGTVIYRETPVTVVTLNRFVQVSTDNNFDGMSDIFFSDSPGALSVALSQGTTTGNAPLLPAGSGWTATHLGDFDGDGRMDFIANQADGTTIIFRLSGALVQDTTILLGAGSGYTVTLLGDFDGDGKADIVLTHTDGSVALLLMDGGVVKSATLLLPAGTPWRVLKAGDFNADGNSDLIVDQANGTTAVLLMNGATVSSASILLGAGSGWSVTHIADFNYDFKADIVLRHTNGATALLQMNGTAVDSVALLTGAGSPWTVTNTGDFNGDGKKDIVVRNTDGSIALLQMNGLVVAGASILLSPGSTATVAQIGDYDGDGKEDILLRNANGSYTVLIMNGAAVVANGTYTLGNLIPLPY